MNPTLARYLKHNGLFWSSIFLIGISLYDIEYNRGTVASYLLFILSLLALLAFTLTNLLYVPKNVPQFKINNDSDGCKTVGRGNMVEMIWNFRLYITNDSMHDAKEVKIHFIRDAARIHFSEDLELDPDLHISIKSDSKTIVILNFERRASKTLICQAREQGRRGDISHNSALMLPTYLTSFEVVIEYKNVYDEDFMYKFIRKNNAYVSRKLDALPHNYRGLLIQ